jgi:uncharacterized protein with NRDE domain
MCVVALALGHPRFPFVVAGNRDEYHERPSAPLGWWRTGEGAPKILGGRDLKAGGTWLGLTPQGRFGVLTNVRAPDRFDPAAPSRGDILSAWLACQEPIESFAPRLTTARYNGFNLIAADFRVGGLHWLGNEGTPHRVSTGVWGVSNAGFDTPWPKVRELKARLSAALDNARDADTLAELLLEALSDRRTADDDQLPSTGVPHERERALSAMFIHIPEVRYGTRCSTLLIAERRHEQLVTQVIERSFDADGRVTGEVREALTDWPPGLATVS